MEEYHIRKYSPADYSAWNMFITKAKNATFLFHRDYMDYHSNRFTDYSIILIKNNKFIAVLPANIVDQQLHSHQGLTYGGLVVAEKTKLSDVIVMFRIMLQYLSDQGIYRLHLKMIPEIYHKRPSGELHYALFLADAKLVRRDSLSVIDRSLPYIPSKSRRKCALRGLNHGLTVKEESNLEAFWKEILIPNMSKKHDVQPVHSIDEILRLHQLFPDNIRHFNVYHQKKLVAGTTVFVTDKVIHPQYISGNSDKNELGSLDFLYNHLISEVFTDKHYFDFGISNESNGRKLNSSLIFWKESFGASTVVQDFYTVETSSFVNLENVLI